MNSKTATTKLVNILKKQQVVINKLAQLYNDQEMKNFFNTAINAAIANSGVSSQFHVTISKNPGQDMGSNIHSEEGYVVTVVFTPSIADNNVRQKLMNNFYAFVKGNKPDLDGRVSLIFG